MFHVTSRGFPYRMKYIGKLLFSNYYRIIHHLSWNYFAAITSESECYFYSYGEEGNTLITLSYMEIGEEDNGSHFLEYKQSKYNVCEKNSLG